MEIAMSRTTPTTPTTALTEGELATRWAISPKTLQAWRLRGVGPAHTKIGNAVRYMPDAIAAYEAENTRRSTSAA